MSSFAEKLQSSWFRKCRISFHIRIELFYFVEKSPARSRHSDWRTRIRHPFVRRWSRSIEVVLSKMDTVNSRRWTGQLIFFRIVPTNVFHLLEFVIYANKWDKDSIINSKLTITPCAPVKISWKVKKMTNYIKWKTFLRTILKNIICLIEQYLTQGNYPS